MTKKKKVGIIGAGASGLTAIKCAVEEGIYKLLNIVIL